MTAPKGGDLMSLIRQAGFTGAAANTMYGIVMAESGGNAQAHNTNASTGDNSYGLAQINMLGSMGPARLKEYGLSSNNDLFDPLTNLRVAYKMSGGGTHFGDWSTYNSGAYLAHTGGGAVVTNSAAGSGSGGGGAAPVATTRDELAGVDSLGHLLDSIPELSKLVDRALSGNWSTAKFQNAVEDSHWWKTHSDTARSAIIQQANDPAAYGQSLNHVENTLQALANQTGMAQFLGVGWRNHLAQMAILTGNEGNQQWLISQLFNGRSFDNVKDPNSLTGQMGQVAQQLQQMSADYGYKWTPRNVATYAARVVSGQTTIDTYKGMLTSWAKSAFPSLASQIDAGATVKDLAAPYQQSMSQLLEIDPGKLDTFDPTIRKALQGTPDAKGQLASTPLWQFENQVRSDPRWSSTDNAHASMSTMALQLGQAFGFNG